LPERLRRAIGNLFENRKGYVPVNNISQPYVAKNPDDLGVFPALGHGLLDEPSPLGKRELPQLLN
jgi:hypothetical protein